MTETKVSNAEANARGQLNDEQLDTATGGSGGFGFSLGDILGQTLGNVFGGVPLNPPSPPTPAGSRAGVPATHRSN